MARMKKSFLIVLNVVVAGMVVDAWGQVEAPTFVDVGAASGLLAEGLHHAVAIGDYNGDGWEDLYVGSRSTGNSLYRNN